MVAERYAREEGKQASRGNNLALFFQSLSTLKTLTEVQFNTTVEQDDLTNQHATSLAQKEREMEVYKRELHHELAQKVSEREVYQQNSDDTIAKLRAEIEDIEKQSTLKKSQLERQSRAEGIRAAEQHDGTHKGLSDGMSKTSEDYKKIVEDSNEGETQLRKDISRLEVRVMQTINQYDTQMMKRQDEIDEVNADRIVAEEKYEKLKEHFRKVDMNKEEAAKAEFLLQEREESLRFATMRLERAVKIWKKYFKRRGK